MNIPYIIITSKALASSFEPLANWRTANGRNARIVLLEDIQANTVPDANTTFNHAIFWYNSGYVDGGTRDIQEAVRNFIKWAYVNWQTEFILLGGDTSVVPDRKGFVPLTFESYSAGSLNTPTGQNAYAITPTCTRIYFTEGNGPNLSNTPPDQLLIAVGPLAGTVIPYLPTTNSTTLGWHFVADLNGVMTPSPDSILPTPYVEICGPAKYHGNGFTVKNILNYVPADLYYADLDSTTPAEMHDWDADNNGIYGENYSAVYGGSANIDGVNGVAKVYVGRFLVSTLADVAIVVNKVINYEKYCDATGAPLPAGFATSALLVAGDWAQEPFKYDSGQCCEDIRTMLAGAGTGWTFARFYDAYWMPYAAVIPAANDPAGVLPLSEQDIVTTIAAGNNLVSLNGRGNPGYLFDIQGNTFLQLSDVSTISNAPGVWFGNASHTNWFDTETLASTGSPDTLSRVVTLNPQGGAVAYVGYSRYGFTTEVPEKSFWNEMLGSGLLGSMLESARQSFNLAFAKYSLNLIGDPAMQVWTAPPATPVLPALNIPHVIITSRALAASFQPLADWRTQNGLNSRVVAVEDIQANTVPDATSATFWFTPANSNYKDGLGTRDLQEAIRNFVKWAAENWQTEFILLGGDTGALPNTTVVPDRKAFGPIAFLDYDFGSNLSTPTGVDLSGSSVSASSSAPGSNPSSVTDGNGATYWSCAPGDAAPSITLTFSPFGLPINHTTLPVDQIELDWGQTAATAYTVQVSTDNQTWTDIYATTTGAAGAVTIPFSCVCALSLRLQIQSGTNFQLAAWKVFGPNYDTAFAISPTCTRICVSGLSGPNLSNTPPDQFLIAVGPLAGTVIPYLPTTDSTTLGWHFVTDLCSAQTPAADSGAATPTPYVEICGPAEYHGNAFTVDSVTISSIPTDLYYADLDATTPAGMHDWDADNNGIYGENYSAEAGSANLDGVNGLATVYVGRFLVSTTDQVATMVNKVINYEKYTDPTGAPLPDGFATSALLVAGTWLGGGDSNFPYDSGQCCENIRTMLVESGADWTFTRLYDVQWAPYAAVIPAADDPASVQELTHLAVVAAIAPGNNVVTLDGHGNPGGIGPLAEPTFIQLSDVAAVSNVPGVWFGNACMTNWFDKETLTLVNSPDTLSRVVTLNPQGGAVAYLGYSRDGLTTAVPVEAFWDEMLDSGLLGPMLENARQATDGTPLLMYGLNLIGDPAMKMWTAPPM